MKITNQEFLGLLRVNFSSVKAGITSPYASNVVIKIKNILYLTEL